jgi:hypothetical protein
VRAAVFVRLPAQEHVIEPSDGRARGEAAAGQDRILRAKYLDWCSARVAERFVKLTPEEIYQLADEANTGVDGGEPSMSFREIVERVTRVLTAEMDLPDFEEWSAAYAIDPARFDEELLGLWREQL